MPRRIDYIVHMWFMQSQDGPELLSPFIDGDTKTKIA